MKTIIHIDVDSDRPQQIKITKPEDMIPTAETFKEVLMNDIVALTETLCLMVETAANNEYMPKDALVRNLNNRFSQILG